MNRLFDLDVAKLFRFLILFEAVSLVAGVLAGLAGDGGLPPALQEFTAAQDQRLEESAFFWFAMVIGCVFLILYPVAMIAMWRFKRVGLYFYLAAFILYPLTFLLGTDIITPGEQLATELSTLSTGLVVGLAFHPEIRRRFGF